MPETLQEIAWEARWRGVRPAAVYHHGWGFESMWRGNFEAWGYPLDDVETDVVFEGKPAKARTFSVIGMVVWTAEGSRIVGW